MAMSTYPSTSMLRALVVGAICAISAPAVAVDIAPLREDLREALDPARGTVYTTAGWVVFGADTPIRVCGRFGEEKPADNPSQRGDYELLDCEYRSGEFSVDEAFGEWAFIYFHIHSPSGWEGYISEEDLKGRRTAAEVAELNRQEDERDRHKQETLKAAIAVNDRWNSEVRASARKAAAARAKLPGARIGMTQAQVLASSWGSPDDINRTITAYGTREQWVYRYGSCLYFDDGVLTAIQN